MSMQKSSIPEPSFQDLQRLHATKMEVYGFAGWLLSIILYVCFLLWAFVPDDILEVYGVTYFPSKHWALASQAMIVMTYLFSIVIYKALNMMITPNLDTYATVLDTHSVFVEDSKELDIVEQETETATPFISDIPLPLVSTYLYDDS